MAIVHNSSLPVIHNIPTQYLYFIELPPHLIKVILKPVSVIAAIDVYMTIVELRC